MLFPHKKSNGNSLPSMATSGVGINIPLNKYAVIPWYTQGIGSRITSLYQNLHILKSCSLPCGPLPLIQKVSPPYGQISHPSQYCIFHPVWLEKIHVYWGPHISNPGSTIKLKINGVYMLSPCKYVYCRVK